MRAFAQATIEADPTPRHPLELVAQTDPYTVLKHLPDEIARAKAANNFKQVGLLELARANACRNLADWICQRDAGLAAIAAADAAENAIIRVRGKIVFARANILLQDFTRAEDALADAEVILKSNPFVQLSGEVILAYASLSEGVGKDALTITYADRGLELLKGISAIPIQTRLLRNRARAKRRLGDFAGARADLLEVSHQIINTDDPKLNAEIFLELARIAHAQKDVATELENGRAILQLADRLKNSQLSGLGHEVMGMAAENEGVRVKAVEQLQIAADSFRTLNLRRDELRALRALLVNEVAVGPTAATTSNITRFVNLQAELDVVEKANAADDFDARLKYAEQKLQVERLQGQARIEQLMRVEQQKQSRLNLGLFVLASSLLLALGALFWQQRRSNRALQSALSTVSESELRFRTLAENAQDIVVRLAPDGSREYVSPSVRDIVGFEPQELAQPRWELVHPDDKARTDALIKKLFAEGGAISAQYRIRHKQGHYLWMEALARRLPSRQRPGEFEVVYAARDITGKKIAEQALAASEQRLKAVANNVPALIAYVDTDLHFGFVNAYSRQLLDLSPDALVGNHVRTICGETLYRDIEPHAAQALAGEAASFETSFKVREKESHQQVKFIPDFAESGQVIGFYFLMFDITERKQSELELGRLARFDSLTGLANRRQFDERMSLAIARSRRSGRPLSLICVDIDQFKGINDNHGHLVGDDVIREFASRLQGCAREEDLVARTGGDEFMVLIEDATDMQALERVAQRIQALLKPVFELGAVALPVTASLGVAYVPHPRDAEAMISVADHALYAAKRAGRNTYRVAEKQAA